MDDSKPTSKVLSEVLTQPITDRCESESAMEPLVLSSGYRHREHLNDLALELAALSTGFRKSIPPAFVRALAVLVRSMNCYYSNLIEGHDTHPVDIERALKKDYSSDPSKRNLQFEAEAHISVQSWIDDGGLAGKALKVESVLEVHKRFCDLLPDELLWVESLETGERIKVVPGGLREQDVAVGKHIPVSPGALPRFLKRYEIGYQALGKSESIIATAAAHHRLLWIHPFLDGNGRVARLISYALLLDLLDTGGIWSIARGLARNQDRYKMHLMKCDNPRSGDLDGRGPLSEEALGAFTEFFLRSCIDQVNFMSSLVRPDLLRSRVLGWAKEETLKGSLPLRASAVLESLLLLGELPRGDIQSILNSSPATARRVISALSNYGIVVSESSRASLKLAFPASLASAWLPDLFPEWKPS